MTDELHAACEALRLAHPDLSDIEELAITRSGHFEVRVGGTWYLLASYRSTHDPRPFTAQGAALTIKTSNRQHEKMLVATMRLERP